jgi:hypothetical protein
VSLSTPVGRAARACRESCVTLCLIADMVSVLTQWRALRRQQKRDVEFERGGEQTQIPARLLRTDSSLPGAVKEEHLIGGSAGLERR